jgi:hypothetical protein
MYELMPALEGESDILERVVSVDLQHFLGHRNIMHTVRYTELRSDRFEFWKD